MCPNVLCFADRLFFRLGKVPIRNEGRAWKKFGVGFSFIYFLVLFSPIILYTDLHNEQVGGGGETVISSRHLAFHFWFSLTGPFKELFIIVKKKFNEFFHRRATTTTTTGKCALKHICEESSSFSLEQVILSYLWFWSKRMERALE